MPAAPAMLIAALLSQTASPVPVPPTASRVVSVDRAGSKVAICAEVPDNQAKLMQRNGRKLPPTHIFLDDGRTVRKVVTGLGGCDPAWSPDGTRLAFTAPDGVWVLNEPDDVGERLVDTTLDHGRYTSVSQPKWSPDGSRLAYLLNDDGDVRVEVVAANTGATLYTSPHRVNGFHWVDVRTIDVDGQPVEIR
jgi:dipeptidyl aminopeptidase/acylaminoacyl peptidase